MKKLFLFVLIFLFFFQNAIFPNSQSLKTIPDSLSLEQLWAFYVVRKDLSCLSRICELLNYKECTEQTVCILNKLNRFREEDYSYEGRFAINHLTSSLLTEGLRGRYIKSLDEIDSLDTSEIDIGRALIFAEFFGDSDVLHKADLYSSFLDLLSLRVLAGLSSVGISANEPGCIEVINKVLFEEMGIRFPSKGEMFSDKFTFLSSLIKDRFGVCLGISSLYLSIAVRIGLSLDIITPPGHIYLRYRDNDEIDLNIETTASGIHIDTKSYEGYLPGENRKRELKEVIGLSFMNRGSFLLHERKYEQAAIAYREACKYLKNHEEIMELYGWSLLFSNKISEGKSILKKISPNVEKSSPIHEFLKGTIGLDVVELILSFPGESYESVDSYVKELSGLLKKYPHSKVIHRRLGSCFLFLGKYRQASQSFEKSLMYISEELETAVILSRIGILRMDYRQAQKYFLLAEKWALQLDFYPEPLRELQRCISGLSLDTEKTF